MKPAHPQRPAQPLLIIGWDGATPELLEPWMEDGSLPNLASLRARGTFATLRSVLPPLSPAAWTTAVTGLNPGRHGIWDFGHLVPGTYRVEATDARHRQGAALWEMCEAAGLKSAVLNVPMSHPSGPLPRGVFVPGMGATSLRGATSPPDFAERLLQEVPDYLIDCNAYEHADPADFLEQLLQMTRARGRAVEFLLREEQPDVMFAVFTATDRVQHAFWRQSSLPWTDGSRLDWRFSSAIKDVYQLLDESLGRLIEQAGDDATVMVVSDHGFGELEGDLYLNGLLEEMGLLTVRRGHWSASLRSALPGPLRRLIGGPASPRPADFGDINWQETRAFSRGLLGNIWLNLRGRQPAGQVEPGPEAEEILEEITARLLELVEPVGERQPLISAVFRGADLYWGPMLGQAPDLVVVPRDYRWMTRSGREIGPPGVITAKPAVQHTGNHRMNGVLVAGGPGIREARHPELVRILDLCPTALALLGIEVPRSLDGVPMEELLSCDIAWTGERPVRPGIPETALEKESPSLEDRLRQIGYLTP